VCRQSTRSSGASARPRSQWESISARHRQTPASSSERPASPLWRAQTAVNEHQHKTGQHQRDRDEHQHALNQRQFRREREREPSCRNRRRWATVREHTGLTGGRFQGCLSSASSLLWKLGQTQQERDCDGETAHSWPSRGPSSVPNGAPRARHRIGNTP